MPPTSRGLVEGQAIFGRYVLKKIIGRGGMGIVWSAHDSVLGEDVALKFLPDLLRWDQAALEELKAETRRARTLTHPHIVRIHDLVEDASGAAISMELVEGRTLSDLRLAKPGGVLDPADILPWIGQLCAALDYAHAEARIVHHDLKPANILLTTDGRIKVTDFGVARNLVDAMSRVSTWGPSGTLLYMSPQQTMGEPPSSADDIYSLGALLYELLTGKPPFYTGDVRSQVCLRVPDSVAQRRKALGLPGEKISANWESTLAACLAKNPEKRPSNAAEISNRLLVEEKSKPKSSSKTWPARPLFFAALLAVAGATGWLRWKSDNLGSVSFAGIGNTLPSDATRAFAAWNFDGDGRDASGRGLHLGGGPIVPTADRHGRIDRALLLNGNTSFQTDESTEFSWDGVSPFTVSLWVRPDGTSSLNATLLRLRPSKSAAPYWEVSLQDGRPHVYSGTEQDDKPTRVRSTRAVPVGEWSHLIAMHDGQAWHLFINGRETGQVLRNRSLRPHKAGRAHLLVGFNQVLDANKFAGGIDDIRLWQRALRPAEIATHSAVTAPPTFRLSQGHYSDKEDISAAVREFGIGAELADWDELRRWHGDDTRIWLYENGLTPGNVSAYVQRSGRLFSDPPRRYFITRFEGEKPAYFLAHGELGGMVLALGSWYGGRLRALVSIPFVRPRMEKLAAQPDGSLEHVFSTTAEPEVFAVSWRKEFLRREAHNAPRAELRLRDGRIILAECAPTRDGNFSLSVGAAEKPQLSRQLGLSYAMIEFTLVVRADRLHFRAVSARGGEPLFMETVVLPELKMSEIASLRVSGVDAAELVVEK